MITIYSVLFVSFWYATKISNQTFYSKILLSGKASKIIMDWSQEISPMGSMLFALTLDNTVIHTSYYLSIWCSILPCFCNVYKHTPFLLKWVEIWKKSQFKKIALKTFNNLYRTSWSCAKGAWWFNQLDLSM